MELIQEKNRGKVSTDGLFKILNEETRILRGYDAPGGIVSVGADSGGVVSWGVAGEKLYTLFCFVTSCNRTSYQGSCTRKSCMGGLEQEELHPEKLHG